MNSLLAAFTAYIKKENLFQRHDKLLVAVSGGVDSVVLCDLCHEAAYDFAIAHCNFQLRGDESIRDETFVAGLAAKYNVPLFTKRFDANEYVKEHKVSVQVAARELRYAWFDELGTKNNDLAGNAFNHQVLILTAHHAGDNVETLLMNFFKGTGINGLKGITPKRGNIVRPLLFAPKEMILNYANERELDFVEDSSNSSDKYTRNYFRNQLIPEVQKVFPMTENNLRENIEKFRDIGILYQQAVKLQTDKLIRKVEQEVHLPVLKLLKNEALTTILYEILKDFGFSSHQVPEVMHLLNSETGRFIQSQSHRVIRNRDWLIISPLDTSHAVNITIQQGDTYCIFGNKILNIKKHTNKADFISTSEQVACIDADKLIFPLLLRKYKTGDYFYPLGMQKKKKLSKFFIDNKLSMTAKENVWVIESDKKILWVVGLRIDDRFKVTGNTREVVKFIIN